MVKVLNSGLFSTIQDLGRMGYQHFGVPYSGAMDSHSALMANAILGNDKNAAVIEMTITGAKLLFNSDTSICVSGADMKPKINSKAIKLNRAEEVKAGDILSFGMLNYGVRCYLAVFGGFETESVMGSRSMYNGITNRFRLHKNDELPISNYMSSHKKHATIKLNINHFASKTIEVYKGPEFDFLSKAQQEHLLSKTFTISKENNRMAYQLNELLPNSLQPIITSSVLPGTVQLTPSGKLIVLMRDCQTTGGYPRVLQLKEVSINALSQKFTNQDVTFKLIEY